MRWANVEILHFSILLSHLIPVPSTWVCQLFMIDICSWCNLYPAQTDCLGPSWLQESQILVSALIHFQLWVFLYYSGGPDSGPAGSLLTILVMWDCACNTEKANPRKNLSDYFCLQGYEI